MTRWYVCFRCNKVVSYATDEETGDTTVNRGEFVLFLLGAALWWKVYQYQDCRKVGHSVLYCLGKFLSED